MARLRHNDERKRRTRGDGPAVFMAWWQAGALVALIVALAWGAALLRGRGHNLAFAAVALLAAGLSWVVAGLMVGGIAPGRTGLMLPASSGVVPAQSEALRAERRIHDLLNARHPEVGPKIAEIERLRASGDAGLRKARLALLASYLPLYAPRASNAAIRNYGAFAVENLEMLFLSDALQCRDAAMGRHAVVIESLLDRGVATLIAVLDSALNAPQEPPNAAEAIALRRQAVNEVYEQAGPGLIDRSMLARPMQAAPDLYCLTVIRILKRVLALPPDEAGMVLRFHYGQEVSRG